MPSVLLLLLLSGIGGIADPPLVAGVLRSEQEPTGREENAAEALPKKSFAPGPTQEYSFADGVKAIVAAKEDWRRQRNCVSCHTNGWGLAAMPVIGPKAKEVSLGREFAQQYLKKYLDGTVKPKGQHGSTEGMVATTAFLVMSDARTSGKLHKVSRQALDHAWELLDESGTWEDWLQCNWPPFESDAEFGPTLMLVALGEIRKATAISGVDQAKAELLMRYLRKNPPQSLHAKAMRLWAAKYWPLLMRNKAEAWKWHSELLQAQSTDGGWSMASLAGPAWKRDGGEKQTMTSEAYSTAFTTYVLQQTLRQTPEDKKLTAEQVAIEKGLSWLKKNQYEGGSWFTRSPRRDGKHYISRAATSFALMALANGGKSN